MADVGVKILKSSKTVNSTTIDDYIFWSKHQSLPFIQKVTHTVTVTNSVCNGTSSYTHGLGFAPFVLAFITLKSISGKHALPIAAGLALDKVVCDGSSNLSEDFDLESNATTIDIPFVVECIVPMVGGTCPASDVEYTVEMYLYMFELGST